MRIVAVVMLLGAFLCSGCGNASRVQLVQVDSERDANRIMVLLAEKGIGPAEIVRTTEQRKPVFRVMVSPQSLDRARAILVDNDLPRTEESGFDKMLANTGLIPTAGDERARLMFATAGELERTLEVYDCVVAARVHIVLPSDDSLATTRTSRPTATVLLKLKAGSTEQTLKRDEISQLVAGAVADLDVKDVKVQYTIATESVVPTNVTADEDVASPKTPGPTVWTLIAAVAVLLIVLLVVSAQLVKANRSLGRSRGRLTSESLAG